MLAFFHHERGKRTEPIDRQKQRVVKDHLIKICRRVGVFLLVFERAYQSPGQRPDKHQIHQRRDQREKYLKDPDVRHRDKAERAVFWIKQSVLVLPHALQRAVRPAETLFGEISQTVRRLGQADRVFFVTDLVTEFSHLDGQVLVLGERVGRKSADFLEHRPPPGADRAGHDRDAVERGKCPAVKILRGDIFEGLPFGDDIDAVADLGIAGDGADLLVGKTMGECRDRLRRETACRRRGR